jgi:uncharacterized membrane protein
MKKWECSICGYIHEGETPPEECPVCGAESSAFVLLAEQAEEPASVTTPPLAAESSAEEPLPHRTLDRLPAMILDYHLHPISVHTPNGILPMAFLFLLIAALFSTSTFEHAAIYSLVFTLLSMPVVLYTGYITWQNKYQGALTTLFKIKIGASIVSVSLLFILVFWRIVNPDIISAGGLAMIVYLLLALVLVGAVGLAGQLGGKLVFKTGGRQAADVRTPAGR